MQCWTLMESTMPYDATNCFESPCKSQRLVVQRQSVVSLAFEKNDGLLGVANSFICNFHCGEEEFSHRSTSGTFLFLESHPWSSFQICF